MYNFDGASGLRNPFLARPQGIVGNHILVDSRPVNAHRPERRVAHVRCAGARAHSRRRRESRTTPRTRAATRHVPDARTHHNDHFAFHTPAKGGHYRWQCFVPCAAGWIYGFGGPMQTIGYMDGFLNVKASMAADPAAAPKQPTDSTNHGVRVVVAWLVLSTIATPLVAIYVGPHIPPGNASVQAQGQTFDNQVMTAFVTPILCLLAVFFAYGLDRSFTRAQRGGPRRTAAP